MSIMGHRNLNILELIKKEGMLTHWNFTNQRYVNLKYLWSGLDFIQNFLIVVLVC